MEILENLLEKMVLMRGIFKAMLSKMGFSTIDFEKDIQGMSEGQKKKSIVGKKCIRTS